jgi:hypothetical protein
MLCVPLSPQQPARNNVFRRSRVSMDGRNGEDQVSRLLDQTLSDVEERAFDTSVTRVRRLGTTSSCWSKSSRRIVSRAWCIWRRGTAFGGMGRAGQPAIGGKLTAGSSPKRAMVSSVKWRPRWTAHSSFCSRRMAPTRRVMASSFGKDADHFGSALDLAVDAFEWIGRVSLARCAAAKLV